MPVLAEDTQLLDRMEKLGLANGQTVGSSAYSEPQSINQSEPTSQSLDDDQRSSSPPHSKDASGSARRLNARLSARRSSDAESVPSAEASLIQTPALVSRAEPVGQQSALHYYKPHDGFAEGCPAPPCFQERVSTAMGIYDKMELRDGELESTLRLLCKVFDVETATVSLLTGERIYLVGACGALPVCVCPDRWGFCGWSFLNPNHELNVVENMEEDARFSQNFFVVNKDFRLVFYVMAPLISSNGHRVGTLCIMGQEPRKFDATRGAILANLSELLVRQIERRWAMQEASKYDGSRLLRAADAYESAVGFVDASRSDDWRLLHLNTPAVELMGVDWYASLLLHHSMRLLQGKEMPVVPNGVNWHATYEDLARLSEGRHFSGFDGVPLNKLLDISMGTAAWQQAQVELVLHGVKGVVGSPCEGKEFDITFRLAAGAALDEHAPFSVGIPSWLRESSDPGLGRNYFFMHITPASSRKDTARDKADMSLGGDGVLSKHVALTKESGMMLAPRMVHKSPIPDLVLGPLLGKGGYGRVFRGLHKGQEVAVKVIERLDTVRVNRQGVPIEVALTQDMHHLGVARCLAWGIGKPDPELAQLSPAATTPTCWMVQELCNKHTLVDAVVKGWFRTCRDPTKGGTHLRVVALTAYEVASAMAYIHSYGIAHLDLSGGNVLLTSSTANPHGFTARVTDFGLARNLDVKARTAPGRYGTITHMAPETIRTGELSIACDVYAWGVLLWEMITGARAWAGMTHEAILEAVRGPWQLAVPPGLPPVLQEMMMAALSKEPQNRPSFKDLLPKLEWYLQLTRDFQVEQLELPLRSDAPMQ